MPAKYTGFDGNVKAPRPTMDIWIRNAVEVSGLKNLGSWVVRDVRGKTTPSVHGTGRAVDLGYSGVKEGRKKCLALIDLLIVNADVLGVELILDYAPKPYGRGWKADRNAWQRYEKPTISGAPGGRWIHVEISPTLLGNMRAVNQGWNDLRGIVPPTV
ncbi:MAG: hypothetical protein ACO3S3_11985 [Pseudohongiellaceae bacterium]